MNCEFSFETVDLPIPSNVLNYPKETQYSIYCYLMQLDDRHRVAYRIAYEHLGTSFHILRSNGYIKWLKQQSS